MTAEVIALFPARQDAVDVTRREYRLASRQYRIACATMKCGDPLAQQRIREADRLRRKTFERYMAALRHG